MALKVALVGYAHKRSAKTLEAMAAGIARAGDRPRIISDGDYRGADHDVAVFWGYVESMQRVMRDYRKAGKPAVYIDFGYWGRGKNESYYKIAVNARHPTAYFRARKHDDQRAKVFDLRPQPWRDGRHILLAGMGPKAAWAEKLEPVASWEQRAIAEIKKATDRPIIYRPKPSWREARPLRGAEFSPGTEPLEKPLAGAHAIVTHHSNVAVDGLIAGVPAFVWDGVARPMGMQDLSQIENPKRPEDRTSWIQDVSYCQWSLEEMTEGLPWHHLKNEGLV